MNRPRLFISAVSEELRTARKEVAATVRTLGFDPVSQADFPTGHGELRKWLQEQVESCDGTIQLVGCGYGAEPPEEHPDFGRISYTQYEFLYSSHLGKKTWVIVIGEGISRDKPIAELDLPREPDHPDPAAYQAERQQLQQDYIARLTEDNHLRHHANSDTELELIIRKLSDELSQLRQRAEKRLRRLTGAIIAILIGISVLAGGGWWAYKKLSTDVQQAAVVTTEKIRAHLLQTAEETHRRELAAAEAATDWQERERLREAANTAQRVRLSRIDDLAASFAEIEGRGTATSIFKEMTRILSEQGVDEAIAYVASQRSAILKTVRARAAAAREQNRADLEPLLRTAGLYDTKGQDDEARTLYTEILDAEPDWPEALHAAFWFFIDQGDIARVRATLADAGRDYEEAHRLALRLIAGDPSNTEWQRNLGVSYNHLGNVAVARGKLAEAEAAYRESLGIAKKLAEGDPSNTQWQRDLSVSYERLGNVAVARGNLAEAEAAYREDLRIAKKLAARDPANTEWQRDLAVSYIKIGDVAVARGNLAEAEAVYRESLGILKKLAAGDPSNTEWQRDLSVSYERLGEVAVARGNLAEAEAAYRKNLGIARKLAAGDPANTEWQRDLAVSYNKIGDVAVARGNLAEAEAVYRESLGIAKKLAASDPSNTEWQRDLAESYWKLADLAERRKKDEKARGYWEKAYEVLAGIEKRGLHLSPQDQEYLEFLRSKAAATP